MAKPTTKQKLAFSNLLEALQNGGAFNMKEIMLKAGYTEATTKCPDKNLTSKKGWNQLLAKIDNQDILNAFTEVMNDPSDKRSRISAGIEMAKLKNLYPDKHLKIETIDNMLSDLREPQSG